MATLSWIDRPRSAKIIKTDGSEVTLTSEGFDENGDVNRHGSIISIPSTKNPDTPHTGKVIRFRFDGDSPPTGIFWSRWREDEHKWGSTIYESGEDDYDKIEIAPNPQKGGRRRKLNTRNKRMRKNRRTSRRYRK